MSDFAGYARTNLFKVKDLNAFREALGSPDLPLSLLQHEELAGFMWTGEGEPFDKVSIKALSKMLKDHILEPVFIIVGGSLRGRTPLLECTVIDPSGKVSRNTLDDIIKDRVINLDDAPVVWAA